jgi:hypothetical protein
MPTVFHSGVAWGQMTKFEPLFITGVVGVGGATGG